MKLILKNTELCFKNYTRELDPDAVTLMAKYTKDLTDGQKWAVSDLVFALKEAGVYSRLTAAYFPALASSVSEAMFDAVTNTAPGTPGSYYVLDANGLGFAPVSSPFGGVRVNTNLADTIQSIFASEYLIAKGNNGINYYWAIGGGVPKIQDSRKAVFPNSYTGSNGAEIPAQQFVTSTGHYALSWRYTANEGYFHTANSDFCLNGSPLTLSTASTDGQAMEETFGKTLSLGSGVTQNSSAGSGDSRLSLALVLGATTTAERDAINSAIAAFNSAFWTA